MLDLSERAVLGPLARLLGQVREAASDTPVLLIGAAAREAYQLPLLATLRRQAAQLVEEVRDEHDTGLI